MPRFRIGLRTLKTALSVVIAMVISSLFGEPSIFPALAAIAVMSRTFDEGLQECKNQAVGICIGGILGCLTVLLWPSPPILIMGLGVIVIIFLCTSLRVAFSCGLSTAIFIVACMTDAGDVVAATLTRLFHTAIGLVVGLAINYAIVPYDNSRKIYDLLQRTSDLMPLLLDQLLLHRLQPDLKELHDLTDRLDYEMSIYHHQRFHQRKLHQKEYSYMSGCVQLAKRMELELTALSTMEALQINHSDTAKRLESMGLTVDPAANVDITAATVTEFHLNKLLDTRSYLLTLLEEKM